MYIYSISAQQNVKKNISVPHKHHTHTLLCEWLTDRQRVPVEMRQEAWDVNGLRICGTNNDKVMILLGIVLRSPRATTIIIVVVVYTNKMCIQRNVTHHIRAAATCKLQFRCEFSPHPTHWQIVLSKGSIGTSLASRHLLRPHSPFIISFLLHIFSPIRMWSI